MDTKIANLIKHFNNNAPGFAKRIREFELDPAKIDSIQPLRNVD